MRQICFIKRAVPKTNDKAKENIYLKLEEKQDAIKKAEKELKLAKKVVANRHTVRVLRKLALRS